MTSLPQDAGIWRLPLENCIFVPESVSGTTDLIYDSAGKLVDWSACRRGPDLEFTSPAPPQLAAEVLAAADRVRVRDRVLFIGNFRRSHYGHWLTEGLSRLWPMCDDAREPRRVITSRPFHSWPGRARAFLRPAHSHSRWTLRAFDPSRTLFKVVRVPARLDAVELILPSMIGRLFFDVRPARTTSQVGRVIADRAGLPFPSAVSDRPVYLSRSRLGRGSTRLGEGEEALESGLRSRGVSIVHPQEMKLVEQVDLFRRHRTFVGVRGSAFHTVLLAYDPAAGAGYRFLYLSPVTGRATVPVDGVATSRSNFVLIDEALGIQSHYVPCMTQSMQPGAAPSYKIDATQALALLREYV